MDALKAAGLCALLAAPPQGVPPCGPVMKISNPDVDRWQPLIAAASLRFGLPAEWIAAVMARESAGLTTLDGHPIISSAGAMGLMQLMPATWSELRLRYGLRPNPFDPHDNIFAGTAYLREMFDRYGYPNLFAAYHAGPGRLDAILAGQKSLPDTTKSYLESIVPGAEINSGSIENHTSNTSKSSPNSLFFMRADDGKLTNAPPNSPLNNANSSREAQHLFVPLGSQPASSSP